MNKWPATVSSRLLLFSPAIIMLIAVVVAQPAFLNSFCSSGESNVCTANRTSDACFQYRLRCSYLSSYSNDSSRIHLRSTHSNGSNIVHFAVDYTLPYSSSGLALTVGLKTRKTRISTRSLTRAAAAPGKKSNTSRYVVLTVTVLLTVTSVTLLIVSTGIHIRAKLHRKNVGNDKISTLTIVIIVASIAVSLVIISVSYCFLRRRARKKKPNALPEENANEITTVESLQFDFATIEAATNKFSDDNKLGDGGFGEVYKGTFPNGQYIAVKRLSGSSEQGAEEFKNEIVVVAKLQHRNFVRLLGFCLEGGEKMLVYEFVPNKSLDYFLFGPDKQRLLDWPSRYKIIRGIARRILYIHEDSRLKVIHRDLKASNILLDEEMNPKISDFGMARLFGVDQTEGNTNRIVGTYGYISPEYGMQGQFSVKSDVYSFCVLVLEILSGKNNASFFESDTAVDLLTYAWKQWSDGTSF